MDVAILGILSIRDDPGCLSGNFGILSFLAVEIGVLRVEKTLQSSGEDIFNGQSTMILLEMTGNGILKTLSRKALLPKRFKAFGCCREFSGATSPVISYKDRY
jgi:hypothetical protein